MKWISPVFVLALVPAGTVIGQSTSSSFDNLAPGPVAEVLRDTASRASELTGTLSPSNVVQPPASNPLPGGNSPTINPLPAPAGSSTRSATGARRSVINEPVPYSQVPQIQKDMYSLEDTFTLPRTPSVSPDYARQKPKEFSPTPTAVSQPIPMATPTPMDAVAFSAPAVETGVCACGSNELAPDNCQCDACQGRHQQVDFGSDCATCDQVVVEECDTCDSFEMMVEDFGCDTCEEIVECNDCEVIGGPDSYFTTEQSGFVGQDDVGHREIKQRLLAQHRQKHQQKKLQKLQQRAGLNTGGAAALAGAGLAGASLATGQGGAGNNVYQPAVDLRDPTDVGTNTLFNISGLYFNRNIPNVPLSVQPGLGQSPSQFLSTGDADDGDFGGFDASLIRRRATGKGFELRYLNLSPGEATSSLGGRPLTLVGQFGDIGQFGGITHQDAFNLAQTHEVSRDMSIQSAEFNFLRMGRQATTRRGQQATFEYLLGFRYFQFEESLSYSATGIRPNNFFGGDITRADYRAEVENELYGAQFGGRSEISFFRRFSFLVGLKAGIFSNNFNSKQRASTRGIFGDERIAQVLQGPDQGSPYNLSGDDTDITLLGELDLGLAYRLTNSIRLRGGYKAIFVDDVAFADSQIAPDFNDVDFNSIPQANDDLVLYGAYFGVDFAF